MLGNYQSGFRPGKSTINQIHTLRQILEKTKEYNVDTYHLFVDFEAAYDSIDRRKLIEAMEEFGIPPKLISLTKATLSSVKCQVRLQNGQSSSFKTTKGLRQGDALACMLFNFALEKAVRDAYIDTSGTIYRVIHELCLLLLRENHIFYHEFDT